MEVQVDREVVRFLVVVDCVDRFEWWRLWECVNGIFKSDLLTHAVLLHHREWEIRRRLELNGVHLGKMIRRNDKVDLCT